MLNPHYRYIALDFETTGLDLQHDEPIQIGIVECDHQGRFLGGFQSLLRPHKPLKELKSIVGFITGLSAETLLNAPSPEEIFPEISHYFDERTIIIGHNIGFDLHFLQKFFPTLARKDTIDTFKLSQELLHYMPSYAQEVLIANLQSKPAFQSWLEKMQVPAEANFHDAFCDAKLSLSLFASLVEKMTHLIDTYPNLAGFLSQSEGILAQILAPKANPNLNSAFFSLPPLKKITPPNTQMLSGKYPFDLDDYSDKKSYQIKDIAFKDLLSSLASHKNCILAFSSKAKLDIAKNLLNELGIKNIGFAKEEQTLSPDAMLAFAQKGTFSASELMFLFKYFSHVEQGLGVLDLNSKENYEIYTALKDQRKLVQYPVILTTHGGLFSLLEQGDKYPEYAIFFFDTSWRYKSFNLYLSRSYDLNYTLNYLEMLSYKYQLELHYSHKTAKEVWFLADFQQFFTMFIGILGQETKKFFTNTDATQQTLEPIKGNIAFYQTNKLLERFQEYRQGLEQLLDAGEFQLLWRQIEHMERIFGGMCVVEKKMYSRSDFYFVYAEEVKFSTWAEFLEVFAGHKTLFLSNFDTSLPPLLTLPEMKSESSDLAQDTDTQSSSEQNTIENQIFHLSKSASVFKALESFDLTKTPNGLIFILSVKKDESKALFEAMISKGLEKQYLLLVENITGGSGKNLFKAKSQWAKVVIGGYNFLLQLFAQKLAISQLIVYNSKWNQQDLIFNDILRYGRENFK